jgi:predicted phosphoadenosine phosphosulfate sulfurtransferase
MDYVRVWESRGYAEGIPDEVPDGLMRENLAPSYRQIATAILKNDSRVIGAVPKKTKWYYELKRIELSERQDPLKELGK